jgi:hypothetical protein
MWATFSLKSGDVAPMDSVIVFASAVDIETSLNYESLVLILLS